MPDELIRCAKCLSSFRSLCIFIISSSFNQGAGGRVIFVLHRGACLSRQDLNRELKISSFSFGSPTPKTVLKGKPPISSLNFASSKCFSLCNSVRSTVVTYCWTRQHITVCNPVGSVTNDVINERFRGGRGSRWFCYVLVQV